MSNDQNIVMKIQSYSFFFIDITGVKSKKIVLDSNETKFF